MPQRLRQLTNEMLLGILAQSKDATAIYCSEDLHISFINDAMLGIWGKDSSVVGKTFEEAIPEIVGQPFTALLQNVWQTGKTYTAKDTSADLIINGKLTTSYFDFEYRAIQDDHGQTYCLLHTATDVTDRKKAWQLVAEKEAKEQALNEELMAANEELTSINEEYQAANEELIVINEELQEVQQERDHFYQELSIREQRLSFSMKAAEIGTWDLDIQRNLVSWDDRCKELYGFSKDDIVPYEQVLMYMHPDDMSRVNEAVKDALDPASSGSYDVEFRTIGAEDQKLRWLHCCGKAFFNSEGNAYRFSGIAQDVTLQKQQADELATFHLKVKEKEEQLTSAKEAAQLGLFDWDLRNQVYSWDARFREIYNLPLHVEYSNTNEVFSRLYAEDIHRVREAVERSQTYGASDGRYDIEYRIAATSSSPLRWVRAIGRTLFNEQGIPERFIGSVLDITTQKADEQRKHDFIGIVSHELRSPLTSLKGYVQMLQLKLEKLNNANLLEITHKAGRQIEKMQSLISGFLDVARMGEGKIKLNRKCFDMAKLVKQAEEESLATITTHRIIYHPVEHTPVEADEEKIEQVLVNFINNAVKYSPQDSEINVSAISQDGFVKVCVTDLGMGISPTDQSHIFDRFYRVDSQDMTNVKGFGIGLYICKEIIDRHGGGIGVNSELGQGSTFWFELPLHSFAQ